MQGRNGWKKRWFVLKFESLFYFRTPDVSFHVLERDPQYLNGCRIKVRVVGYAYFLVLFNPAILQKEEYVVASIMVTTALSI